MTVEVETPQGLRTGSAVIEITSRDDVVGNLHSEIRGEAAPVTLPDGTIVFALLRNPRIEPDAASYALVAFAARLPPLRTSDWQTQLRALRHLTGAAELPRPSYPSFVRFRDRRDWRTLETLEPERLGESIRVRRVLIEITADAVTHNVPPLLPWPVASGRQIRPGMFVDRSADRDAVRRSDFVRE